MKQDRSSIEGGEDATTILQALLVGVAGLTYWFV